MTTKKETKTTRIDYLKDNDIVVEVLLSVEELTGAALEKASKKLNGMDVNHLKVLETTQRQKNNGGGFICKVTIKEVGKK